MECLKFGRAEKKYNEEVRTFCLTLHYYSPRAYNYVRTKFNDNLPSVSAMRNWYASINASPGLTTEAFDSLRIMSERFKEEGRSLLVNLVFDEMSIRRHAQWNVSTKKFDGYVDVGRPAENESTLPLAKDALVYLVSGVCDNFKIPVAYFLTNGLITGEKAALTSQVLIRLNEVGVEVTSMTFDGCPTNIAMCTSLGADFKNGKPYIPDPANIDRRIHILLDPAHMLKLARTCIAMNKLIDGEGGQIEWKYFQQLFEAQKSLPWNLGNKITRDHMRFDLRKMCVKLAAQTLSNSVADSMEFLKAECAQFEDVDGTVKYIRTINDIFDIMNSTKSSGATGFKRPISSSTHREFFERFDEAIAYFQQLRIDGEDHSVLSSASSKAFFGFHTCMISFKNLYGEYVESGRLTELITHRFSQDLIETLFSCIRAMHGFNDNPTAQQFEAAYRKLQIHNDVVCSGKANCIDKGIKILTVSSQRPVKRQNDEGDLVEIDTHLLEHFEDSLHASQYFDDAQNHSIAYIASVLETRLIGGTVRKYIKCQQCIDAFVENELIEDSFIRFKARNSNIIQPCKSTFDICKFIETFLKCCEGKSVPYNMTVLQILQNMDFDSLFARSNFDTHDERNHKYDLVKKITETYLNMRSVHVARCMTLKSHDEKVRHYFKKQTHLAGQ